MTQVSVTKKAQTERSGQAVRLHSVKQQGGATEQPEADAENVWPGGRLRCVSAGRRH